MSTTEASPSLCTHSWVWKDRGSGGWALRLINPQWRRTLAVYVCDSMFVHRWVGTKSNGGGGAHRKRESWTKWMSAYGNDCFLFYRVSGYRYVYGWGGRRYKRQYEVFDCCKETGGIPQAPWGENLGGMQRLVSSVLSRLRILNTDVSFRWIRNNCA